MLLRLDNVIVDLEDDANDEGALFQKLYTQYPNSSNWETANTPAAAEEHDADKQRARQAGLVRDIDAQLDEIREMLRDVVGDLNDAVAPADGAGAADGGEPLYAGGDEA